MKLEPVERIDDIPLLPIRDLVVLPNMVIPLFVGREASIRCLEEAMERDKRIVLANQRNAEIEAPEPDDLHQIGTYAKVLQLLKLPDGSIKALVEGVQRSAIEHIHEVPEGYFVAQVVLASEDDTEPTHEMHGLVHYLKEQFGNFVQESKNISPELLEFILGLTDYHQFADSIASNMPFELDQKQHILEEYDLEKRLEYMLMLTKSALDQKAIEKQIRNRVREQVEKTQREYYLTEQMKAIQKELDGDDTPSEIERYQEKITEMKMPKEAHEKVTQELRKLKNMQSLSAEAGVIRSYIDWMLSIPWHKRSRIKKDLAKAQARLDDDHSGLERVKDRIIEYLAVQQRVNQLKGPILCLVGPPGVGKTSLGRSIAAATGREYLRMALGGVRDEAEIRGHRRTYIGSLPGKVMQKIVKSGVKNPLFLLDEIDKMSSDMRGDPASALLEVLDPEQNGTFNDHYLEVDYDLSDVMFVATSNSMNIPAPLLDRMEVIRLSGYTEDEKIKIAQDHLLDKQIKLNGLKKGELKVEEAVILAIIRNYTREAGVRGLERELAKLCRKAVKAILLDRSLKNIEVTPENLSDYLGVKRYDYSRINNKNRIGQVSGLAWNGVGGDLLTIEAESLAGKGKLNYTGSLGDVMQESIQAATTVVRSRTEKLGIASDYHEKRDIHVHVPEGATPKDGPSAGIAVCTALVSALTGNPVCSDVAMTGEITLRGEVLPIGGLQEKLLAARRAGVKIVLIPEENRRDLEDIAENVRADLDIRPVRWIDEVLEIALEEPPMGIAMDTSTVASRTSAKPSAYCVSASY